MRYKTPESGKPQFPVSGSPGNELLPFYDRKPGDKGLTANT